jgi:hypothetical protein
VSSLWIVDSGTDWVYQFDNAAGATTGSLSPSANFGLAAGNTNPQGIADPPTGHPVPAGSAPSRSMSPVRTVAGRLALGVPSSTLGPVRPVSLSALDQALDGLRSGSSMSPGPDEIIPDVFHARRRRAN